MLNDRCSKILAKISYNRVTVKDHDIDGLLQELQCISNGVTTALHEATDISPTDNFISLVKIISSQGSVECLHLVSIYPCKTVYQVSIYSC